MGTDSILCITIETALLHASIVCTSNTLLFKVSCHFLDALGQSETLRIALCYIIVLPLERSISTCNYEKIIVVWRCVVVLQRDPLMRAPLIGCIQPGYTSIVLCTNAGTKRCLHNDHNLTLSNRRGAQMQCWGSLLLIVQWNKLYSVKLSIQYRTTMHFSNDWRLFLLQTICWPQPHYVVNRRCYRRW